MQALPSIAYPSRDGRPLVLGHRGASADAPENTLAAFREAVRQGADGVELDVMVCGSGELVVCHDDWLDRLAGEHLQISTTSLATLRKLDVGRGFGGRFAGERIPLLAEVLADLPAGAVVNVELKCETVADRGLASRAAPMLCRHARRLRLLVSSFNPLELTRLRELVPDLPTGMLVASDQSLAAREVAARLLGASALHPEWTMLAPERLARWRSWGLALGTWTVDEPEAVRGCAEAGVAAIISNRPAQAVNALGG